MRRHGLKLAPFPALARIVELAAPSTPPDLGHARIMLFHA